MIFVERPEMNTALVPMTIPLIALAGEILTFYLVLEGRGNERICLNRTNHCALQCQVREEYQAWEKKGNCVNSEKSATSGKRGKTRNWCQQ